jgi:hypothetical protein
MHDVFHAACNHQSQRENLYTGLLTWDDYKEHNPLISERFNVVIRNGQNTSDTSIYNM